MTDRHAIAYALRVAEAALAEAHQNVTGSTDHRVEASESMYAEPLRAVRFALGMPDSEPPTGEPK